MAHILISYRRQDSDVFAGRVRDKIADRFGDESVFMDIDSIPFGRDFRTHVKGALGTSDVVIVVIGNKWLGATKSGVARILDETDPVRIEVETALENKIPVIPVLAGDAKMPKPTQLPDSLKDFAFINAATVDTGRDFHPHMERVMRSIEAIIEGRPDELPSIPPKPVRHGEAKHRLAPWHIGLAVALIAAAGAVAATIRFWPDTSNLPGAPAWCRKAESRVEKVICSDASFFAKDQELTTLYNFILARRPDSAKASFVKEQRDWLDDRDLCQGDDVKDCIRRKYNRRIAELKSEPRPNGN